VDVLATRCDAMRIRNAFATRCEDLMRVEKPWLM
jgi:hypothetical protein